MSSLNTKNAADQQFLNRKMTRRLQSSPDVTSQQEGAEWTSIEENNA